MVLGTERKQSVPLQTALHGIPRVIHNRILMDQEGKDGVSARGVLPFPSLSSGMTDLVT